MNEVPGEDGSQDGTDFLRLAADCFSASTSYMDANYRKNWERNIALFQSKHPNGSKYNSAEYKHRSRLFRPKTRSLVRKNESASAAAFFSNTDVVSIEPQDNSDPVQKASADLWQEVLNYRLDKTIPWFLTVQGAYQETNVIGIVCSYQYWNFKEKTTFRDLGDGTYERVAKVVKDEPCCELMPVENYRFDPGASWLDPVGTSPYFIRLVPMYAIDVQAMMDTEDSKTGQPKWRKYDIDDIREAMADYDTTRMQRDALREDKYAPQERGLKEYDIVWCHENFVRIDGEEWVFWTLGTKHMLTEPTALGEVYFTGERPFVIGFCNLEAHKAVPEAPAGLGSELQKEANELANQRRDNVSLVLNKRYFVKRDRQVDIQSLLRNVAGGVTMMTDPTSDVQESQWADVTGSSYQEQDRLNADFDGLMGDFNPGSIQTNRAMNDTVGGMNMLRSSSAGLTEYSIRTFVETWVEPVLRQLVKLEQAYETDQTILTLCAQTAEIALKYGADEFTDEILNQELTVRVNVGMNATDPQAKLQKFMGSLMAYSQVIQAIPDADPEAIRKELFGLAGYRDGARFFQGKEGPKIPPQVKQQMQQMQMQGQALEEALHEAAADVERLETENQQLKADRAIQAAKAMTDRAKASADIDLTQAQTAKTVVEAMLLPSQMMVEEATSVDDEQQ